MWELANGHQDSRYRPNLEIRDPRRRYENTTRSRIASRVSPRENLEVLITDGIEILVPPGSVTLAYSNQVLEHLHPDDADEHFRSVYAVLGLGGRCVCLTPTD
jgi:Methyltransferase domain